MKRYAAALIFKGDQVLLGKRAPDRKEYPGFWDILGGHCKKSETMEDAMLREVKEETGIDVTGFTLLTIIERPGEFIMVVYMIFAWTGEVYNAEPAEHEYLQWWDRNQAMLIDFPEPEYRRLFNLYNRRLS